MTRSRPLKWILAVVTVVTVVAALLVVVSGSAPRTPATTSYVAGLRFQDADVPAEKGGDHDHARPDRPVAASQKEGTTMVLPAAFDVSPALRLAPHARTRSAPPVDEAAPENASIPPAPSNPGPDAAQQTSASAPSPASSASFEGIQNPNGYVPPDTNGDVSEDYFVEWVNAAYGVFNKSDGSIAGGGPFAGNAPWASWAGNANNAKKTCAEQNQGDPIVKYDRLAKRWILTQFAFVLGNTATGTQGPYYQCVAVSTSSDPLGTYYLYAYQISTSVLNDYPKLGIWPNGYYFTFNGFSQSGTGGYVGTTVAVADRAQMVAGNSGAKMLIRTNTTSTYSLLPGDLEGTTLPPAGTAETFAQLVSPQLYSGGAPYALQLFTLTPNFSGGSLSWAGPTTLNVTPFSLGDGSDWIVQPTNSVDESLDALADRLMYRLAYRNLGSKQVLTVTHTVDVTGSSTCQPGCLAAPRWYQLERTSGSWSVAQQSTFVTDNIERWMSSMAIDHDGNLGMVYSTSGFWPSGYPSGAVGWPSVAYTGRLATDTPSTLEDEHILVAGDQAQTATCGGNPCGRWGDYSSAEIDPTDDCTFWIAGEYFHSGGNYTAQGRNWHTRIGSFFFPGCMDYAPTAAGFGSQVVIRGKRFENASAVSFNGNAASTWSTDSSAHTLTVTVPDTATSGPITVTSPDGTFVGETSFSIVPSISGFLPTSGVPGDSITISGGPFDGATDVKFNGTSATDFTVDTSTQITATIPNGATSGPISVVVGTATGTSSSSFTVLPYVGGATPSSATVGTKVTINGSGFTGATAVTFNGVSTSFKVVSDTAITAKVPDAASFGPIGVTAPGGTVASATSFVVIPTISGLSPSKGSGGRSVSIKGSGFTGVASVTFNGTPAAFTVTSSGRITATMPTDASSGPVVVTLSASGQTATSSKLFKAQPAITGMSPATGPVGTTVVLTGTNLLEVTSVAIGSAAASFHVDSATQITLTIPSGAKSNRIKVNGPAGNASSQKFTVTA